MYHNIHISMYMTKYGLVGNTHFLSMIIYLNLMY